MAVFPVKQDTGYAWVVLLGAFLWDFMAYGVMENHGIFFVELKELFLSDATTTSLVFTSVFIVSMLSAPLFGSLADIYQGRWLMMLAAIMGWLSMFLTVFMRDIKSVVFTFGILSGVAYASGSNAIIPYTIKHFDRYLGLISGVMFSGSYVASLILPSVISYTSIVFGTRGMFLLLSGLWLHLFITSAIMRPIRLGVRKAPRASLVGSKSENKQMELVEGDCQAQFEKYDECRQSLYGDLNNEVSLDVELKELPTQPNGKIEVSETSDEDNRDNYNDQRPLEVENRTSRESMTRRSSSADKEKRAITAIWELLTDKMFMHHNTLMFLTTYRSLVVQYVLPAHGVDLNMSRYYVGGLVTAKGIAAFLGSFIMGRLSDMFPRTKYLQLTILNFVSGVVTFTACFYSNHVMLYVLSVVNGYCHGNYMVLINPMRADLVSEERLGAAGGITSVFFFLPMSFGPTVSGALRDAYGSYIPALLLTATVGILAAGINAFPSRCHCDLLAEKTRNGKLSTYDT